MLNECINYISNIFNSVNLLHDEKRHVILPQRCVNFTFLISVVFISHYPGVKSNTIPVDSSQLDVVKCIDLHQQCL